MKYWEIIGSNLSRAGWSWGYTTVVDCTGRTLFSIDAHRDDGRRYVVRSDQLLTAFLELERAVG
jgi:precorrin-6B methylase 1